MKGWSGGECGVTPNNFCKIGSGLVSGPGSDYSPGSKSAQYYGLCSVPKGKFYVNYDNILFKICFRQQNKATLIICIFISKVI